MRRAVHTLEFMQDPKAPRHAPGPFHADQLRTGDRYELDNGHPVYVSPSGGDGARGAIAGAEALDTDPEVDSAGMDAGFALEPKTLRAPDVSVGRVPDAPGWIKDAPLLAVEYASTGQDEAELQSKIVELLGAGTRYVWVVRLVGPRRVEVYQKGMPMRVAGLEEELAAPGVLRNRVPVKALFDRQSAHDMALRNLLQRKGYADLDGVLEKGREEGREQGREEGLEQGRQGLRNALQGILRARGISLSPAEAERIASCHDLALLGRWLERAATAKSAADMFG
jgi:Uma2 family endonuclease